MSNENILSDKEYVLYKGRPLVRKDSDIYYGDMSEKNYIFMVIMSETDDGEKSVPDQILVQLCDSKTQIPSNQKIVKGFTEAFEYADAWLERFNK